jgi:hypothetical protein
MKYFLTRLHILLLASVVGLIAASSAFGTATVIILNNDKPGVGFNDPGPPVAGATGNSGATLGEQRLIAFQAAANIWGATLVSGPTITISASWPSGAANDPDPSNRALPCTANSATLGSAGNSGNIWRNFSNSVPGFWYGNALANALTNTDMNGGGTPEINARFNVNLGTAGCFATGGWYYGLDNLHGPKTDLITVALHEFGHGLGFQTFTSSTTGAQAGNAQSGFFPTIYDRFLFDFTANKTWAQMTTDAERQASAINTGNLVWNGPQVTGDSTFLGGGKDGQGHPLMFSPNPLQSGSSVSHWDGSATPNQLMEPSINSTLGHGVTVGDNPQDLTFSLLRDIGWCAGCPQPPPPSPTPTPSPPPNDNFVNAQVISGCSGTVTGTNVASTHEAGEPTAHVSGAGLRSVWYRWTAPSTSSVTITTAGSGFDTVLAVYTGSSVNGLTLVPNGNNDDIPDVNGVHDVTSSVTINVTAGQTYQIAVDGFNNGDGGGTGSLQLNWTASNCAPAPTIMVEEGATTKAVAVDSITLLRGPFKVLNPNNFNTSDPNTRVILFTSSLGTSSTSNVTVTRNGISLTVENVGTVTGTTGLSASYIIVRLPTGLATGELPLTVSLFGVPSTNNPTLGISP